MGEQLLLCRKAAVLPQNHRDFLSAEHRREVYLQIRNSVPITQARMKGFTQKQKVQKNIVP